MYNVVTERNGNGPGPPGTCPRVRQVRVPVQYTYIYPLRGGVRVHERERVCVYTVDRHGVHIEGKR